MDKIYKTKTMQTLKDIAQAATNTKDDANNHRGVGTRREEKGYVDGFSVKFFSNVMVVSYHTMINIKETHKKDFEDDIMGTINSIVKNIKKEYKSITGSSISLTKMGELEADIEYSSYIRVWLAASCKFKIGGIDVNTDDERPTVDGVKEPEEMLKEAFLKMQEDYAESRERRVREKFGNMEII